MPVVKMVKRNCENRYTGEFSEMNGTGMHVHECMI